MLCLDICPVLRLKQSTECWALYLSHLLERGQLQVWGWGSALIQLCWFRSQCGAVKGNISMIVLPPRMGHTPSKQIHNTRTKFYLGSRRNLRNQFHSRPISLPGLWLAPESAPFWLLASPCTGMQEVICLWSLLTWLISSARANDFMALFTTPVCPVETDTSLALFGNTDCLDKEHINHLKAQKETQKALEISSNEDLAISHSPKPYQYSLADRSLGWVKWKVQVMAVPHKSERVFADVHQTPQCLHWLVWSWSYIGKLEQRGKQSFCYYTAACHLACNLSKSRSM